MGHNWGTQLGHNLGTIGAQLGHPPRLTSPRLTSICYGLGGSVRQEIWADTSLTFISHNIFTCWYLLLSFLGSSPARHPHFLISCYWIGVALMFTCVKPRIPPHRRNQLKQRSRENNLCTQCFMKESSWFLFNRFFVLKISRVIFCYIAESQIISL